MLKILLVLAALWATVAAFQAAHEDMAVVMARQQERTEAVTDQ